LAVKEKADPTYDVESALARGWSTLEGDKKDQFTQRFEQIKREGAASGSSRPPVVEGENNHVEERDEDVEMGEDAGTPSGAGDAAGFTAVNKT
jgi:hypothetical protein